MEQFTDGRAKFLITRKRPAAIWPQVSFGLLLFCRADCVDGAQLLFCERGLLRNPDVLQNLFRLGRADQYAGHLAVAQDPAQRHLCQRLPAIPRNLVQRGNLPQFFRGKLVGVQETPVALDPAVLRNPL